MAQRYNCTPEEIEEAFTLSSTSAGCLSSNKGMRLLQERGYKCAEYCEKCGHRMMESERRPEE